MRMNLQQVRETQAQGRIPQPEREPWTSPKQMILLRLLGTEYALFKKTQPSIFQRDLTQSTTALYNFSGLILLQEGNNVVAPIPQTLPTHFPHLHVPFHIAK